MPGSCGSKGDALAGPVEAMHALEEFPWPQVISVLLKQMPVVCLCVISGETPTYVGAQWMPNTPWLPGAQQNQTGRRTLEFFALFNSDVQ